MLVFFLLWCCKVRHRATKLLVQHRLPAARQCCCLNDRRGAQGFIKKYVQCYSCGNPETVVKIRKENIFLKCKACGAVSDVDARQKLNTYILKNPPEEKVSKAEKKCGALACCSVVSLAAAWQQGHRALSHTTGAGVRLISVPCPCCPAARAN